METEDIKAIADEIQQNQSEDMELDQPAQEQTKGEIESEEKLTPESNSTSEDILRDLMDTSDPPVTPEKEESKIQDTEKQPGVDEVDNPLQNNSNDKNINEGGAMLFLIKPEPSENTNANEKDNQESMETESSTAEPESDQSNQHQSKIFNVGQNNIEKIQDSNNDTNKTIPSNHTAQQHNSKDEVETALSALASAAINHGKDTEIKTEPKEPKEIWHTVGFIKGTSFNVQNYFYLDESVDIAEDQLLDVTHLPKINLEPGTAYKFRVAAVNSVGKSDWSEMSAFRTCVPGFPSAPSAIKITKSADGAHISWEPPKGEITEYSVYLAVRNNAKENVAPASMAFVRVYAGASNSCVVPHTSLASAYVDTSTKSAIIFRIAARNEKGYGPATQVRWLQDSINKAAKRPAPDAQAVLKKTRNE